MTGLHPKTLQQQAEAQRLRAQGLTQTAIARQLGVSRQYVSQLLSKSGQPSPWTPEALALLGTMPDRALANRLGVHWNTVFIQRRALGIKPFGKRRGAK
jgi:transcriptional regulator with XRE-family HTH domain